MGRQSVSKRKMAFRTSLHGESETTMPYTLSVTRSRMEILEEPAQGKTAPTAISRTFHFLSKENQVSLLRIFFSRPE